MVGVGGLFWPHGLDNTEAKALLVPRTGNDGNVSLAVKRADDGSFGMCVLTMVKRLRADEANGVG